MRRKARLIDVVFGATNNRGESDILTDFETGSQSLQADPSLRGRSVLVFISSRNATDSRQSRA
jgi:hypothetical protein